MVRDFTGALGELAALTSESRDSDDDSMGGSSPDDPTDSASGGQKDTGDPDQDPMGGSGATNSEEEPGSVVARIIAPAKVVAGEPALFSGTSSTGASVFTWDFDDGKRAGVAQARRATVRVPKGPATMVWVNHPGFASHARRVRVEADFDEGGYRVVMIARAQPRKRSRTWRPALSSTATTAPSSLCQRTLSSMGRAP